MMNVLGVIPRLLGGENTRSEEGAHGRRLCGRPSVRDCVGPALALVTEIVLLPKPLVEDPSEMPQGAMLWGWSLCV